MGGELSKLALVHNIHTSLSPEQSMTKLQFQEMTIRSFYLDEGGLYVSDKGDSTNNPRKDQFVLVVSDSEIAEAVYNRITHLLGRMN